MDILADAANPFLGVVANGGGFRFNAFDGGAAGYGGSAVSFRRGRRDVRRYNKMKSGMSAYSLRSRFGNYLGAKMFGGKNYYLDNGYSFGDVARKFVPGILGQAVLGGAIGIAGDLVGMYASNLLGNAVSAATDDEHGVEDVKSGFDYAVRKRLYDPKKSNVMFPSGHRENFKKIGRMLRREKEVTDRRVKYAQKIASRRKRVPYMRRVGYTRGFGSRPTFYFR